MESRSSPKVAPSFSTVRARYSTPYKPLKLHETCRKRWPQPRTWLRTPPERSPTDPHPELHEIPSRNCHGRVTPPFPGRVSQRTEGAKDVLHLVPGSAFSEASNSARRDAGFSVRILDGHIAGTAVESTRNIHRDREVSREASTVGRDRVPDQWQRGFAASPVEAGRMAGGHRSVRSGGGHVAGGRAAGRRRVDGRAPRPQCGSLPGGVDACGPRRGRGRGGRRCRDVPDATESAPASTTTPSRHRLCRWCGARPAATPCG